MTSFLGLQEAANFLGVKPSTIYAWVHQRRIPFRKHGRRLVFSREDLYAWSEGNKVEIHNAKTVFSPYSRARNESQRNGSLTSEKREWPPTSMPKEV